MTRFLALTKHIVETKQGFAQLTRLVEDDLSHALHKGLGFSKIDWDIAAPLNGIRHYLGIVAGYGPNTRKPHILKCNGALNRGKPIQSNTNTVEHMSFPGTGSMVSLRDEWHDEKQNLNRQAQAVVEPIASKIASYVATGIDFPAMEERSHGIALTSFADDFIDQYIAALNGALARDKVLHFSTDPGSVASNKSFISSRELEGMLYE